MDYYELDINTGKLTKIPENSPPQVIDNLFSNKWQLYNEVGNVKISTVFLVINHGYAGIPILFETMIFGGKHNEYQERYSTLAEARKGHLRAIDKAKTLKYKLSKL